MQRYNPKDIEPKWQARWEADGIYKATEDPAKNKKYILEYFPYPSGAAMHVGHVRNYTIGDALARYNRMAGFNVLHPMGWDAFGLPAENYAIKNKISPRQAIDDNTKRFKQQLMQMGFSYDWSREIDSTDPKYYKWTQWFFLLLFKRGLAYQKDSLQWWCPHDKTVLANEQVEAGVCWRCGHQVEKKALKQWFFKITDYADRLDKDLDDVNWSDAIKAMQRNWIGRSKGAEITFQIAGFSDDLTVFSTRPDTLYGATFMVLAPEHPLVKVITSDEQKKAVEAYVKAAQAKSDIERQETDREKTGVFTGVYAINPATKENIPIWVADYVLYGYGTGAIMAVPAHDERDFGFAQKFGLPVIPVVAQDFGEKLPNAKNVDGVVVIGYDPKTKKYLQLKNGPEAWLVGGGREADESYEAAARRELAEEAGFGEVTQLIALGDPIYSYYYNRLKASNRRSLGYNYLAIIDSSKAGEPQQEAHEKFTVDWTDFDSLYAYVSKTAGGVHHWMEALQRAKLAVAAYERGELAEKEPAQLPVFRDPHSPIHEGEPFVDRTAVQAIVQHPTEDTYLMLKLTGWESETYGMPLGGIDDGEAVITAAMRELAEETGYVDHGPAWVVADPYEALFYHEFKKENRRAKMYTVFTKLRSLKQEPVSEEEKALHELHWVSLDELQSKAHGEGVGQVLNVYRGRASVVGSPTINYNPVPFHGEGAMINSGPYNGMPSAEMRDKLVADLAAQDAAKERINYKIRDWLISRQRYWGAPIPIIHCPKDGPVAVPDDQLPVKLPEIVVYEPSGDGRSPLATVPEFVNTTCPKCGGPAERETDTMDGFACSSWYFLRFADPHNDDKPFDDAKAKFWLPVDDYIGGAEHAVMHLLYARMWTKVMFDAGLIDFQEPFTTLRNHGMILAPDGTKMSKSKGNTIEPGGLIDQGYGADAIRIMELFIGPWNQMANWSVESMGGAFRFLQRIWTLTNGYIDGMKYQAKDADKEQALAIRKAMHALTKKVTKDIESLSFNTAVAAMMEYVNMLYKFEKTARMEMVPLAWLEALTTLLKLLAPFAPHIAEELWHRLGDVKELSPVFDAEAVSSIHTSSWPKYDDQYLVEDTVTVVIQVNGKVRAQIQQPKASDQAAVEAAAKAEANVVTYLNGKQVTKVVYVPGRLINFVVK